MRYRFPAEWERRVVRWRRVAVLGKVGPQSAHVVADAGLRRVGVDWQGSHAEPGDG